MASAVRQRIDLRSLLKDLTRLDGVSGSEHDVVRHLRDVLADVADSCEVDRWGNIVAEKSGTSDDLSLIVGAHSDEIGFYVKSIDDSGFLRLEPVGGVPVEAMPGRAVSVGDVPGVIGAGAWHLGKKVPGDSPLYVDVGAASRAEAEEVGVRVGSPVTLVGDLRELSEHRVAGKAMDNRVACAVVVGLLDKLQGTSTAARVFVVVTVQEEVGLRGARMVAERLPASAAISVDVSTAGDTPDCDGLADSTVRLGAGPVISLYDQIEKAYAASLIGIVSHRKLNGRLLEVARARGIPVQPNVLTGGGADAAAFHLARGGIPATQVSVPGRYSHSAVETIDMRDVEACVQLLAEFVLSLDEPLDLSFL